MISMHTMTRTGMIYALNGYVIYVLQISTLATEQTNQKIKTAVTHSTKLHKLFNALLNLQASKSVECSYAHAVAVSMVSKIRYQKDNGSGIVASVINDICMPYAADLVLKQLDTALKFKGTATVCWTMRPSKSGFYQLLWILQT